MRSELTAVEKRIADYVISNPSEIPALSVHQLAEKSSASDASVLRFCRDLGYAGYRSFIVSFSVANAAQESTGQNLYTDVRPGDSLSTIADNVFYNAEKALSDTRKVLDSRQLEKAVQLLEGASQIHFFGISASGLVCMDAQQKFSRIHKVCYAHTESHDQLTSVALMDPSEVAVFLTYSGRTREILEIFSIAASRAVPTIVISGLRKNSPLEDADATLHILTPEVTIRSGAMGSRIAMLTVIDILFSAVVSRHYDEVSERLLLTHQIIEERKR